MYLNDILYDLIYGTQIGPFHFAEGPLFWLFLMDGFFFQ